MIRWLFLFLLFGACASPVVLYTNDKAHFEKYHTYVLLEVRTPAGNTEKTDSTDIRIKLEKNIRAEMNRRNYRENLLAPDLVLRYEIISGTVSASQRNFSPSGYLMSPYYYPYSSRMFTESIFLLELTDATTKKLIWQASLDMKNLSKKSGKTDMLQSATQTLFNTYLYNAGEQMPDESLKIK
ncbi:MAG: DUF4136 domain-containing protein [Cyclobacteriaceae bacterium]|nr:DUF4136 domain-containing protein [Cyclobacteriaceae bacterium]